MEDLQMFGQWTAAQYSRQISSTKEIDWKMIHNEVDNIQSNQFDIWRKCAMIVNRQLTNELRL